MKGTYGTLANGYALMNYVPSGIGGGAGSLGNVSEPSSPLMQGVGSFGASAMLRSKNAVAAGAIVVAWYNTGEPLVLRGTKGGRTLVELNFSPRSGDWTPGGDGAKLVRNALKYSTCKQAVVECQPGTYATAGL